MGLLNVVRHAGHQRALQKSAIQRRELRLDDHEGYGRLARHLEAEYTLLLEDHSLV